MKALNISGLILGIISINYFFSYVILKKIMGLAGLDVLPLISMEDITFSFGMINYTILSLSSIGLIVIFCFHVFYDENKYYNLFKNVVQTFVQKLTNLHTGVHVIIYFLILISVAAFYIFRHKFNVEFGFAAFFILMTLGTPLLYIYMKAKREFILLVYVMAILIWGLFFINKVIFSASTTKSQNKEVLKFEYKNEIIQSTSNYYLVYAGYKYIIMRNDSTGICDMYPTNEVQRISYRK